MFYLTILESDILYYDVFAFDKKQKFFYFRNTFRNKYFSCENLFCGNKYLKISAILLRFKKILI